MKIETFHMERWQSAFEHNVEFNLSESGVQPLRLDELICDSSQTSELLNQELSYTQTNGTQELREVIAAQYPGTSPDNVLVTNGGAEANFLAIWHLLDSSDEAIVMAPNYPQIYSLAHASAGNVHKWWLRETHVGNKRRWRVDLDELHKLITPRTKMIAICNPNNPTGSRLDESTLKSICEIAEKHGTWILSDEIYRGAERDNQKTPSVWGQYERVIVTSGFSKAYGLPGLRIGWIITSASEIDTLWAYHDYTTIAPGALNDYLATRALSPQMHEAILARTQKILKHNYPIVREWVSSLNGILEHIPPEAGAIAYLRYKLPDNSTELANKLREQHSVLIVPGDHFGMDGYFRIGYGANAEVLKLGLERLGKLVKALATDAAS